MENIHVSADLPWSLSPSVPRVASCGYDLRQTWPQGLGLVVEVAIPITELQHTSV